MNTPENADNTMAEHSPDKSSPSSRPHRSPLLSPQIWGLLRWVGSAQRKKPTVLIEEFALQLASEHAKAIAAKGGTIPQWIADELQKKRKI